MPMSKEERDELRRMAAWALEDTSPKRLDARDCLARSVLTLLAELERVERERDEARGRAVVLGETCSADRQRLDKVCRESKRWRDRGTEYLVRAEAAERDRDALAEEANALRMRIERLVEANKAAEQRVRELDSELIRTKATRNTWAYKAHDERKRAEAAEAKVRELEGEVRRLDGLEELWLKACDKAQAYVQQHELGLGGEIVFDVVQREAERQRTRAERLERAIREAPHAKDDSCEFQRYGGDYPCTCWKAAAIAPEVPNAE